MGKIIADSFLHRGRRKPLRQMQNTQASRLIVSFVRVIVYEIAEANWSIQNYCQFIVIHWLITLIEKKRINWSLTCSFFDVQWISFFLNCQLLKIEFVPRKLRYDKSEMERDKRKMNFRRWILYSPPPNHCRHCHRVLLFFLLFTTISIWMWCHQM